MRSLALLVLLAVVSWSASSQTLTIRVHAPSDTPDSAALLGAGNLPSLGSWQPDGLGMMKGDSAVWSARVTVPEGTGVLP